MSTSNTPLNQRLTKIRWCQELNKRGHERNVMSPELANALRNEIRTALEADGGPFDVNVARRVYDLAIAARDMCVAATVSVKEAIDQIKDTNGPMETLDTSDTPESQIQVSESFGARLLRELMATVPMLQQGSRGDDPKQLVHALAEARRNGMHDVAEQIEVKLFGRVLSGPRPIAAEEIEKIEEDTSEHRAAIEEDIRHGRSSMQIRDEIIAQVGMMAHARPPEMQARYNAALAREKKIDSPDGPIPQAHANGAPL